MEQDVEFLECGRCRSLQTQEPTWLGSAYAEHLSSLDTGAAQRVLRNHAACFAICRLFGLNNVLDFGGGDGLLCRLLRDYGINCYVRDKYSRSPYAQSFREPDFERPDLVVAFEVLEHLARPDIELEQLFRLGSKALIFSTNLYENQGPDWWYLMPESGQHVFFYSRDAIKWIARKYACTAWISGDLVLLVRKDSVGALRRMLARLLLNRWIRRGLRALLALLPASGVWADHRRLKAAGRPPTGGAGAA